MRPITIVLVVVALGIAGITAWLAKSFVDRQSRPAQVAEATPAAVESVLVAARDVAPGSVLIADDLRYESWPRSVIGSRLMVRSEGNDPKGAFVGAVARRAILAGEPVTAQAAFRQDEAGVLAEMLSPGMRAVSIPIDAVSAVAGFVLPGDRVDIHLSADFRNAAGDSEAAGQAAGPLNRYATELLLGDVRVMAIANHLAKGSGANVTGGSATVEVTPDQAQMLITAGLLGRFHLVLRGAVAEPAAPQDPKFTTDIEASRLLASVSGLGLRTRTAPDGAVRYVKINRAGSRSTQTFSN